MKMKILMIYMGLGNLPIPKFHHGIGSLAAVLKEKGHLVSLLYAPDFDNATVVTKLDEFSPHLIGISFISPKARAARRVCDLCARQRPQTPIVLGGIHPTVCPEECIHYPGVTAICIGEGEESFLHFVSALDSGDKRVDIPGLWINDQGHVVRNPVRQWISDLNALPFADREIFDHQREIDALGGRTVFITGRGCPFNCSFCVNRALGQLVGRATNPVRRRSVGHVIREIEQVVQRYEGVRLISFQDDTFTLQPKWLAEFCSEYARRVDIPFICQSRADTMNPRIADLLASANCVEVRIGLETGDDYLRNQVLGKRVSRRQIIGAFDILQRRGIRTMAYVMIGVPFETRKSLQKTYDLCVAVNPNFIRVSTFQPFPGTQLLELCEKEGWLNSRTFETLYDASILDQPGVTQKDLDFFRGLFQKRFRDVPEAGLVSKTRQPG